MKIDFNEKKVILFINIKLSGCKSIDDIFFKGLLVRYYQYVCISSQVLIHEYVARSRFMRFWLYLHISIFSNTKDTLTGKLACMYIANHFLFLRLNLLDLSIDRGRMGWPMTHTHTHTYIYIYKYINTHTHTHTHTHIQ